MTMDAREFLAAAARVGRRTGGRRMPQDALLFELDHAEPPDVEAQRARLEALLGAGGFDLWPYGEDDPTILVLRFARVRREQSSSFLFAVCRMLERELGLRSAVPQVDPVWSDTETAPAGTEGVGEAVWRLCRSDAPSPADPDWARRAVRADAAEREFGVTGAGIRIGQPDTGVAAHRELESGLRPDLGFDFVDDLPEPRDPLLPSMGSPGHGTATAGCVVSRDDHTITGTARGAQLVPIRCVDRVVIGAGTAVARAVDHARHRNCHVVTMSLGGAFAAPSLRRAVRRASESGMIVLAAAGNCVGFVVYPARDRHVIAVAGVDSNAKRWKGSSRGRSVAFSAPGENVHVARRSPLPPSTSPDPGDLARIDVHGQGTSYAVATAAGCAALWLERHGPEAVRAEAARRGISVNDLFLAAVAQSAHRPTGWNAALMGAGVIDARALCALDLAVIGAVPPIVVEEPAVLVFETAIPGALEAEANLLALDWHLREAADAAASVESVAAPYPSERLAALLGRDAPRPPGPPTTAPPPTVAGPPTVADAGEPVQPAAVAAPAFAVAAPAVVTEPRTPPLPPEAVMRTLSAAARRDAHVMPADVAAAIESIGPGDVDPLMERITAAIGDEADPDRPPRDREAEEQAIQDMDGTLRAVARARPGDMDELAPLVDRPETEAIVVLTGRPVIPVSLNGRRDWRGSGNDAILQGPRAGTWGGDLFGARDRWRPLVNAVGRVDVRGRAGWIHAGTGFLVGPDLVLTNRHVAQGFAEPRPVAPGENRLATTREATIVFDSAAGDDATRFQVTQVVAAGAERIGGFADPSALDAALLRIDPGSSGGGGANEAGAGAGPPEPIPFAPVSTDDPARDLVLVAGYPARTTSASAPRDPALRSQYFDRLFALYGTRYGVKYISPGQIIRRPGAVPGDRHDWSFAHDASTLGGNSGSLVLTLDADMALCGLHFGGATLSMNLAHDLEAVGARGDRAFDLASLIGA